MQIGGELPGVGRAADALYCPVADCAGGWLYGRDIWVPPMKLLAVIAEQQFVPLLVGMALMWLAPAFSARVQRR